METLTSAKKYKIENRVLETRRLPTCCFSGSFRRSIITNLHVDNHATQFFFKAAFRRTVIIHFCRLPQLRLRRRTGVFDGLWDGPI